jgi:hypothetical protein
VRVSEGERQQQLRRSDGDHHSSHPAGDREHDAFQQGLRDDLPARSADRQAHGRLAASGDRACQ